MQPPQKPDQPSPTQPDSVDLGEFERSLADVEQSLVALKQRYTQVQQDLRRQAELQQRAIQVGQELSKTQMSITLKAELRQIKEQLEAIEISLESQLFSWGSLKEPFWQAVRFGGLGVVVGWILKSCTG
jgi:hypothetical protein